MWFLADAQLLRKLNFFPTTLIVDFFEEQEVDHKNRPPYKLLDKNLTLRRIKISIVISIALAVFLSMVLIGLFTWYHHKNPTFATIVASPKITDVDHEVNKLTSSIEEFQVQMHIKVYTHFLML